MLNTYFAVSFIRYHEHEVDDDIVTCETVQDEKCEDVTQGYTTEQRCTKWPVQQCQSSKENVKKYSPETDCKKVPRQLCGPSGCQQTAGPEECFDRFQEHHSGFEPAPTVIVKNGVFDCIHYFLIEYSKLDVCIVFERFS